MIMMMVVVPVSVIVMILTRFSPNDIIDIFGGSGGVGGVQSYVRTILFAPVCSIFFFTYIIAFYIRFISLVCLAN